VGTRPERGGRVDAVSKSSTHLFCSNKRKESKHLVERRGRKDKGTDSWKFLKGRGKRCAKPIKKKKPKEERGVPAVWPEKERKKRGGGLWSTGKKGKSRRQEIGVFLSVK